MYLDQILMHPTFKLRNLYNLPNYQNTKIYQKGKLLIFLYFLTFKS